MDKIIYNKSDIQTLSLMRENYYLYLPKTNGVTDVSDILDDS